MTFRRASLGAAFAISAALALASAAPASATVFTATSVGVLVSGFDGQGLFVAPSGDLTGLAYKVVTTIDSSKSITAAYLPAAVYGGSAFGPGVPSLGPATITINGVSKSATGTSFSTLEALSGQLYSRVNVQTEDRAFGPATQTFDQIVLQAQRAPGEIAANIFTPLPGDYCSGASYCGGLFNFFVSDNATGATIAKTYGALGAASFTITAAGVPEPGVWTMLLLGFGGLGAMVRSRRRQLHTRPV